MCVCQCLNCSNSYNICPCVKYVKSECLLSLFKKKTELKNVENVVAAK